MKGSSSTICEMLGRTGARFVVPIYQRKYSWKQNNCIQLFNDLLSVVKEHRGSHFFGSIVSANEIGTDSTYIIIDGQQRITTVSLLLLAMSDLLDTGELTSTDESLSSEIRSGYLKIQNKEIIKLKLAEEDNPAYENLFWRNPDEKDKTSDLFRNYGFFVSRMREMDISVDELYNAVKSLEVIDIVLQEGDDAQLIFESLNSTGLRLSESDKILNYILMNKSETDQIKFYKSYWKTIRKITGDGTDWFIRDFLSVKTFDTPMIGNIYQPFKEYAADKPTDALLSDMYAYVKRYDKLLNANTESKKLNKTIERLNYLGTGVTRPFLLEVLRLNEEKVLSMDEVEKIFDFVESYVFRRAVCNISANSLNRTFLRLHKEIVSLDGTTDDYFEKFKYIMLQKESYSAHFPKDGEFIREFSTRDMFNTNRCAYVLERLETHGTLEVTADILDGIKNRTFTIEHIMPRTLSPEWEKDLGPDHDRIHEEWMNRIGNLTLTAYNSQMSNLSFQTKKKTGYNDSHFMMNQFVAKQETWTEETMKERTELLMKKALDIWRYPETSYEPEKPYSESFTLANEDFDVAGKRIAGFSFHGREEPTKNWIGMYQRVLQILYSQDPSYMDDIVNHVGENKKTRSLFLLRHRQKLLNRSRKTHRYDLV